MRLFHHRISGCLRPASRAPFLFAALAVAPFLQSAEPAPLATARDTFKEYIEIRKLIGEESTTWASQQIALADMVAVIKAEISQLETTMESLKSSATSADQKRADLSSQIEAGRTTSNAFNSTIATFETDLKAIGLRLPEPLSAELKPLFARLPENPANTRLSYSQRLQSAIGLMAQVDKFNADLKFVSAVQDVGGESLEVQTIYFGLGAALFSDAAGKYSGFGRPTAEGWKWERAAGLEAIAITQSVEIYLSRRSPAFVSVPLVID